MGFVIPPSAQDTRDIIRLERGLCFGTCPAYLLQIEASGAVSFRPGPPSNRHEEHTSWVTKDQFATLIARCNAIRFFELKDAYEPGHEDGSQTSLEVMLSAETKKAVHFENGPPQLLELEREIESIVNIHRWLHGNSKRFSLQLPVAGPGMASGEDIKSEVIVRDDVLQTHQTGIQSSDASCRSRQLVRDPNRVTAR
ncbi:MAG: hypothetical protein JWN34_219 [Bryobacterales bacterium]|nr:hypothetical protein [Bryobacterales bacterium]